MSELSDAEFVRHIAREDESHNGDYWDEGKRLLAIADRLETLEGPGNPTQMQLDAATKPLHARIVTLEQRLELTATAEDGRRVKLDIGDCDGIGCRDETIRQQDKRIETLERYLAELDADAEHDIQLLMDSVNTLERENATLRAGYPEGATPTDVRVMREANVALATEVARLTEEVGILAGDVDHSITNGIALRAENARLREALEKIAGVELPCIADVDVWLQMRGRARKALEKP